MTATLQTQIDVNLLATAVNALDLGNVSAPFTVNKRIKLTTGTGSGQADKIFTDTRTVSASGTDALDLAGSLVDSFGATMTFVKLKGLLVRAAAGNTNACRVNRPASNGVPLFLAASDGIDVLPGGVFLWVAPGAGVTVTAATGDLINIDNSSSGTSVTYDVVIIGTSA
jgi:hypothetical protein